MLTITYVRDITGEQNFHANVVRLWQLDGEAAPGLDMSGLYAVTSFADGSYSGNLEASTLVWPADADQHVIEWLGSIGMSEEPVEDIRGALLDANLVTPEHVVVEDDTGMPIRFIPNLGYDENNESFTPAEDPGSPRSGCA
jgi:hypothetical protein